MQQWLTDNREDYEFYLLHAMLHDFEWRCTALAVPVTEADFQREEYALVTAAISSATKVMRVIGGKVETPPAPEFLRTYLESAAREFGADEIAVGDAIRLVQEMQDPTYTEQHYCIRPYFQAWYSSQRAKKITRKIQMQDIPDVQGAVALVQTALSAAGEAASAGEADGMSEFLEGTSLDREPRHPTGVEGLDTCLNGGWGKEECYLLFGGTGSGKSIVVGQCAWHEIVANHGAPLIVSTELPAAQYCARILSNAVGIPINILQDCENLAQIRQAVAGSPGMMYKLPKVEDAIKKLAAALHVSKISADDGMDSRSVLEREVLKYEKRFGRTPTWVCLDWLGSMADISPGSKGGTSERAMAWEISANGCVKFAEESGIPTLVLAQAVNDAQLKRILTLSDIGISKGIGKNMIAVIGVTNTMDKAGVAMAMSGKAEMPRSMFLEDQFFCLAKARKGEGNNIPVRRDFRFQRFVMKTRD